MPGYGDVEIFMYQINNVFVVVVFQQNYQRCVESCQYEATNKASPGQAASADIQTQFNKCEDVCADNLCKRLLEVRKSLVASSGKK